MRFAKLPLYMRVIQVVVVLLGVALMVSVRRSHVLGIPKHIFFPAWFIFANAFAFQAKRQRTPSGHGLSEDEMLPPPPWGCR